MEVTIVSPSPASPTEGDDLCETDVTNVAIHSVTLLFSLGGLVGNGAVLRLHSLKDRNIGIFELAFADFVFLLFSVPSALLFLVEDVSCSSIMHPLYLSILSQLSLVSCYWALFRMTRIRSIVGVYKLCCRGELPPRLLRLVDIAQYWAFFLIFIVSHTVRNLCLSHQGHCRAALISTHTIILLLCAAPVVISHTINFIKAMRGSKEQQPEKRDIIIFLIVLFILLLSLFNLLEQLAYTVMSSEVLFLLNCTHSSIKPFIYFLAGRCWRPCSLRSLQSSLQRVFDQQEEETALGNDAPMDIGV